MKKLITIAAVCSLAACAVNPQQQANREAKRIKAEQQLQIYLAKQCDSEAAELIAEQFNPPLSRSPQEQKAFEKRYLDKVENPVFKACYKLALENYKAKEEIEYLRMQYYDEYPRFGWGKFCRTCW